MHFVGKLDGFDKNLSTMYKRKDVRGGIDIFSDFGTIF
jgi:hypothetical protein